MQTDALKGQLKLLRGLDHPLKYFEDLKDGKITNLILDINQYCNYGCLYCGNSTYIYGKCDADSLTIEERKKVIMDSKRIGATSIFFAGEGEPTVDPSFHELVMFNKAIGLITIVYTNAYTLDESLTNFLYKHDVSLVIKLDSLQEKTYNLLVGGNFYNVFINNLKNIRKVYGNQNPLLESTGTSRIQVSMLITKYNVFEIKAVQKYCREEGYIFCCKTPGKKGSSKDRWDELIGDYESDLREISKRYTDKEQTTGNIEGKCSISTYGLAVTRTGNVAICESVREPFIGNIRNHPIEELVAKKQAIFDSYGCPACVAKYLLNSADSTTMFEKKPLK